jgi:tetratricopeptide (TPR) repeat protein
LFASDFCKITMRAAFGTVFIAAALTFAQSKQTGTASVHGHVSDALGAPAVDVFVFLEHATELPGTNGALTHGVEIQKVRTSGKGAFNFPSLDEGSYTIYAQTVSGVRTLREHLILKRSDTKTIDLAFRPAQSPDQSAESQSSELNSPNSASFAQKTPDFYDEPEFTVAGVTEASNSGGHGIENIKRASEALVKATGSLSADSSDKDSSHKDSFDKTSAGSAPSKASLTNQALEAQRTDLRARITAEEKAQSDPAAQSDSMKPQERNAQHASLPGRLQTPISLDALADLHHQLAQLDETLGDPLEAVNEDQRAEELAPTEAHCFDWATELLTHRAFEPATEIFEQGHRHYPHSTRMLLGLGVAWYARGDDDQAAKYFRAASDLTPSDPTPYMFLGRMEVAENVPTEETVNYLARFARLVPGNAWSNYYYAVGLWKRALSEGPVDDATFKQIEALLQRAIQLDPKFGEGYQQLGTLYGAREDYSQAIAEFVKAIAINPDLEEAHYRLALAYRRTGNAVGAEKEMKVHEDLQAKAQEEAERRRKSILQFVISLKD